MRHCKSGKDGRGCGRFTFNHNPRKGSKKCPDCKQPWSCDMCDDVNRVIVRGQVIATKKEGESGFKKCYMCSEGYLEVEKIDAMRK